MSLVINSIAGWIYNTLASDTVITKAVGKHPKSGSFEIYEHMAPQGATLPYIVFTRQDARTISKVDGYVIFVEAQYRVIYLFGGDSFAAGEEVSNKLASILNRNQSTDHPLVAGCRVTNEYQNAIAPDGIRQNALGVDIDVMAYMQ